jgi:hypothetical protein
MALAQWKRRNMPLVDVEISPSDVPLPPEVIRFLDDADARIDRFLRSKRGHTDFIASDSVVIYQSLCAIAESQLSAGPVFCEWGCGFGVATTLASMLDFTAYGIEVERDLVDAAQNLAVDYGSDAEFVHGSFVPRDSELLFEKAYAECSCEAFRVATHSDRAYDELGLDPCDFDLVFSYPWPGEEYAVEQLFDNCASNGALLMTYGQRRSVRLQRQVASPE